MKLRLALEEKQLDVRLRDRLVAEKKLSKEDIKKHLDSIPDEAKNAIPLDQDEARNIQ